MRELELTKNWKGTNFLQLENQDCQFFAIETIEVNIQHPFLLTYFFL